MSYSRRGSFVSTVFMVGAVIAYWQYVQYALLALVGLLAIRLALRLFHASQSVAQNFALKDVDTMDGISFEHYIAQVLLDNGFSDVLLTEEYDYGVDIVAKRDGIRWGIQTKRYAGLVKAEAVRQVVTGLRLYECDRAMVITNSTFSKFAERLADGNDCLLIDRSELYKLTH